MKIPTFVVCFLIASLLSLDLGEIRKNYPLANESKEITKKMYDALSEITRDDKAVFVAYKGGITALMAKHAKGIKGKKTYFQEGVALIEHAIKQDNDNLEIRCIRLGIQEYSPKFLKYKNHIEADKKFILAYFSSEVSQEIKDFVKGYVQQSPAFSPEERQLF